MKHALIYSSILLLALYSCKKDSPVDEQPATLTLNIAHQVADDPVIFETSYYTNAAGNQYRVTTLKYFISGIELYFNGRKLYRQESPPGVISAKNPQYCNLTLTDIPAGNYDSISFCLGVVPEYNYTNAFELNYNHLGLYWPTELGGGYHFMQFEGHWKDGNQFGGFAFHIGQNENLIATGFPVSLSFNENGIETLDLIMDLNEWFDNPHLYDLKVESGYTMGDTVKMNMLVENGHSVFRLKQSGL